MTDYTLYGLIGPDSVIRYVGQTQRKLAYRLREHRKSAIDQPTKGSGADVRAWIKEVGPDNVEAVVIATFSSAEELDQAEREEIARRQGLGELLLNKYDGGIKSGPKKWDICKAGLHELSGSNVLERANGGRRCRECARLFERARYYSKNRYVKMADRAENAGEVYFSPRSVIQDEKTARLVLDLVADGLTFKEIGAMLGVRAGAVAYVSRSYEPVGEESIKYIGSRRSAPDRRTTES